MAKVILSVRPSLIILNNRAITTTKSLPFTIRVPSSTSSFHTIVNFPLRRPINRFPFLTESPRFFGPSRSTHSHHHVNDSGSIDSPLINSMHSKIKEQLKAESVVVKDAYGDGRHVSIDVISSVFEGESAVSRQRMVYKAIWEELQNTVHAVDQMTTKTPSEAATNK